MLQPVSEGARQYVAGFANSYLIRRVVRYLTEEGFISAPLAARLPRRQMHGHFSGRKLYMMRYNTII